jgi:hypothetical protein
MSDALKISLIKNVRLILMLVCTLFASCSNDFSPNLETEGIPVVYAMIDPGDSI